MRDIKQILIIDDDSFMRVLLSHTLEDLTEQNIELLMASNGNKGLELALSERPALIFLDVMMPGLNGFQVCRQIKEADDQIYIIMLTAKGRATDREQGKMAGADEYITKPFDPDYILKRTVEILGLEP